MTADISSTVYASKRKELLALINQLRAVGAQNDLDLPRITVIGNQSAGKSSVVEALSGITVPRDSGTCTRCPLECRLVASSRPWSCQISIRNEFDHSGHRLREVSEVHFGGLITDKSQVELALRRAQFSVLNPEVPQSVILGASAQKLKEMATEKSIPFSQNVVCVDIKGPELTDLSFIDLPGLIQNADPEVVKLVEDMVVSYIKGNCLILVAVPMTDDLENQKALRLANQEDRDGRRTIGVLTKPDMIDHGSTKVTAQWIDVIEDRTPKHHLTHGYYCTRHPNDDKRGEGIDSKHAREIEEAYFKTTAPWSTSLLPGRFGTRNLVMTLSRLLVQIIGDNLSKIRDDTSKQLSLCREELSQIPPPITEEPATHLLSLITAFCSEFQTLVHGRADAAELIRAHRQSYGELKRAVRRIAPNFIPFTATQKIRNFNNCLGDEEDDPVANVPVIDKPSMNLTDIRKHIDQSMTRELPNNVPFQAKASLIVRFQAEWPKAVDACFRGVEVATSKVLLKMTQDHFGRFALLQLHVRNFIKILMEQHERSCSDVLKAVLEAERMPYTQNDHYLESSTQAWLDKYKAVRSGKISEEVKSSAKVQPPFNSTQPASGDLGTSIVGGIPPSFSFSSTSQRKTAADANSVSSSFASAFGNGSGAPSAFGSGSSGGGKANSFAFGAPATASASSNPKPPQAPGFDAAAFFSAKATATDAQPASASAVSDSSPSNIEGAKKPVAIDETILQEALSLLVKAGVPTSSLNLTDLVGKLTPPDEYERELRVCSEVRGYFQVAYKRMIDNIPRFIDLLFVRELGKTLQPFLISKFGLGTPSAHERCATYLGEDLALVARRDELLARKKRLESVDRELEEYSLRI
ncbi:hypothetical protein GYMLUDRAFT_45362 [Collybiopsis luxurians FD-317 M1]|uniref:Dynamin GTPase n=1 Tax=Collybiopsis luxurians FD-317 M1 TaxID=944289 RepID=A0A0D0CIM1_9AGAR|nr:hypothetical protein GYMLUDRAFT_45362 [Collybiopsis luxurians FD-317 M1]